MITTVTTTTTATIHGLATASLTLIVVLTLLALLIQKEVIGGLVGERARRLSRALNIAIMPLATVFVTSLALRIWDALR